jgi:hypothetical protein
MSDRTERGDEPIDAEFEEASRRRPRASGGVSFGVVVACSTAAALGGAVMGAAATRTPALEPALAAFGPRDDAKSTQDDDALNARLALLEARWSQVETATGGVDGAAIAGRIVELQNTVHSLESRIGDANFAAVAAQVAALQAETDTIRAQSNSAAIAARAAFAVSAATEAARASGPFEQAYATLETILPGDPNIVALAPLAKTGAPSRQELKEQFETLEGKIVRAARISAAGAGFWGRLQAFLAQFVTVRRTGESETPTGMVERASARLASDDVAGAVAELSRLTGPAAQVAGPWVQRARTRLEIDARLAAIRAELSRGRTT